MADTADTEVGGFSAVLVERLKQRTETAAKSVERRTKDERRADMTDRERGRRKEPRKQLNMRVTGETYDLAHELAEHLDKSIAETVALALAALAVSSPTFKRKHGGQQ